MIKSGFVHSNDPIKGVNGKPFIKFDIDADMERMDEEICKALAQSNLSYIPMVYGEKPPELTENRPPFEPIKSIAEPGLSSEETRRFKVFNRKIDAPWAFSVTLKPNKFETRDQDLYPWTSVAERMPYTKKIIQSLPFSEIGKVIIYGSWAGSSVPCHRDEPSSDFIPHINFNPNHYRPVFIWDPVKKEKIFLPKDYKFYAYNVTDYHGVDPLPHFSYTVRVDGKYLKELNE